MMNRLVECVPNFSEGRKLETVERLAEAIESVGDAVVLDMHMDADHNRSVITFVAEADVVVEAAVRAVALAAELIDLRAHVGQHPRVGATDVLPFVPVREVTIEDCVRLAHEAGERIARELQIPVYFYERAALRPERVNLEDVRRGGFEILREEIAENLARSPDVGPQAVHESAGATIVGARPFLVAYNINLRTSELAIARRIARAVRGRDGGLRYLKALGFELKSRGLVQVSMNLVDFEKTELHQAFEAVRREAERYGVAVAGSEIVGLIPQAALDRSAEYFLQIENYAPNLVLENRIQAALAGRMERDERARERGDAATGRRGNAEIRAISNTTMPRQETAFAASTHLRVPASQMGGGSAAAQAAALGAALGEMIAHLTEGRERYADVQAEVRDALAELTPLRERLEQSVEKDAASFQNVLDARSLSQETEAERVLRGQRVEAALKGAATVPLLTAGAAVQVLELLETLSEIGNANALSDAATGAQLALAAVASARYNVLVNTAEIEDEEFADEHRLRADDLLERAREIAARVEAIFLDSLQ